MVILTKVLSKWIRKTLKHYRIEVVVCQGSGVFPDLLVDWIDAGVTMKSSEVVMLEI